MLRGDLHTVEAERDAFLEQFHSGSDSLRATIRSLEDQTRTLTAQLCKETEERNTATFALATACATEQSLRDDLEATKSAYAEQTQEIQHLTTVNASLRENVQFLQSDVVDACAARDAALRARDSLRQDTAHAVPLRARVRALEDRLADVEDDRNRCRNSAAASSATARSFEAQAKKIHARARTAEERVKDLQTRVAELSLQNHTLLLQAREERDRRIIDARASHPLAADAAPLPSTPNTRTASPMPMGQSPDAGPSRPTRRVSMVQASEAREANLRNELAQARLGIQELEEKLRATESDAYVTAARSQSKVQSAEARAVTLQRQLDKMTDHYHDMEMDNWKRTRNMERPDSRRRVR